MAFGRPKDDYPRLGRCRVRQAPQRAELPSHYRRLAVHLSVARSSIYLWAKDPHEFSDILEQLMAARLAVHPEQSCRCLQPNHHEADADDDYTDKQQIDHTTDGKPIAGFNLVSNSERHWRSSTVGGPSDASILWRVDIPTLAFLARSATDHRRKARAIRTCAPVSPYNPATLNSQ